MQEMQEEAQQSNQQQPFLVVKNARVNAKQRGHLRKQSYQHQSTTKKKTRKMTIQVEQVRCLSESQIEFKCESEGHKPLSHSGHADERNNQEQIMGHLSPALQCQELSEEQNNEVQEINIPINQNEWELDKESPYLKNYKSMGQQIEQLKLDQQANKMDEGID